MTFANKRKSLRLFFSDQATTLVKKRLIPTSYELHFSEHLCERLIERKLEDDKLFIVAIIAHFIKEIFNKNTYSDRKYLLQLGALKVGVCVDIGKASHVRRIFVTTAFTSNMDYECDEKINLKW